MKYIIVFVISSLIIQPAICQEKENHDKIIFFHGLILDANSFIPIANSQILINRTFSSVSRADGTFFLSVLRKDTVIFNCLGYKSTVMYVSDTLDDADFIAGIYMEQDTVEIGEVVILPRYSNIRSDIMNNGGFTPALIENARYNVAVSAYHGRNSQNILGDPAYNYELLRQKQKVDAFERGGIPSDQMLTLNPLMLIPAAYLLMHGLPDKPAPVNTRLTDYEVDEIQKKYLEILRKRK